MKFQKGNTHGKGRPKGSRDAITKAVLAIVEEEVAKSLEDGQKGLAELREDSPESFWRFVASLVPKEIDLDNRGKDNISFTMILHDPKSLETNDTPIELETETLPIQPTQDGEAPANGSKQAILEGDTD